METWPFELLPEPDQPFSGANDLTTTRIEMESGRLRQRRRFTENRVVVNIQWTFDFQQYKIFTGFVKNRLRGGADTFLMELQMGGRAWHEVRFINGGFKTSRAGELHKQVTAQLETVFIAGFCTPNLAAFLTIPFGDVDLSMYFGVRVASPFAATNWRLITDDCGFQITYYTGVVNADGTLNPGPPPESPGLNGWHADTLTLHSNFSYPEGVYLQLNCGGKWSIRPCIAGGNDDGVTPP